jgi:hypothetical protein
MSIAERMASLAGGPKPAKRPIPEAAKEPEPEGGHSELHDHGDGTFHTITSDGERTEHPHITHATAHLAAHHEPEGKHLHIHQDGAGEHHSSQAEDGGKAEGPHDHENLEALKDHMDQFLTEEEHEDGGHEDGGHEGIFGE